MKHQLKFLSKENELNKVLKQQKRTQERCKLLFTSLWDSPSDTLISKLKERYGESDRGEPVYIINSFYMPHSFVIFSTTKIPHLIKLGDQDDISEDYLPSIYRKLGL